MPKVFISYEFDDPIAKSAALNWKKQNISNTITFDLLEPSSNDALDVKSIKSKIKLLIDKVSIVMVIVGNNTHSKNWIHYEIQVAMSKKKKIFWTQAPNRTGGAPQVLSEKQFVHFELESVERKILELQMQLDAI